MEGSRKSRVILEEHGIPNVRLYNIHMYIYICDNSN